MSVSEHEPRVVEPVTSLHAEIGRGLWVLEFARQRTNDLLEQVDAAALDWQPEWTLNSIGTLLYHIALIEFDWLHVEVLGNLHDEPYPDEIAALFPHPVRTNNRLTVVSGVTLDEHRARLAAVRRDVLKAYGKMTLDAFRRVRTVPEGDVSPEWVVYYLSQHEAEHRAEIAMLNTQYKAGSF